MAVVTRTHPQVWEDLLQSDPRMFYTVIDTMKDGED